jgi:hypothetical protein
MRQTIALLILLFFMANWLAAENATFNHVRIHRHRSPQGRMLAEREGTLTFDDVNRKLTFQNIMWDRLDDNIHIEAPYDSVTKVIFDSTMHMRGEGRWGLLNFAGFAGILTAAAIAEKNIQDSWLYLEYKDGDRIEPVLLKLPGESLANLEQKAANIFGGRTVLTTFPEHGDDIPPKQLRTVEFKSKYTLKLNKKDHPIPTDKLDKATVIVVCPMVGLDVFHGSPVKLHANGRVVAVNEMGTYSFAYLDPGKYRLVSQSVDNDNGFETDLDAGKTYYFLQNSLHNDRTVLSRNSGEVVTYLAADTYLSEWKPK